MSEQFEGFKSTEEAANAAEFEAKQDVISGDDTETTSSVEAGSSWLENAKQIGKDLLLSYFSLGDGNKIDNFIGKALSTTVSGIGIASLSEMPAVVGHHVSTGQKEMAGFVTVMGLAGLGMSMYETHRSNQARKQEMAER